METATADQEKIHTSLARLAVEDPSFRVRTNEETGQTLIAGIGYSTHLRSRSQGRATYTMPFSNYAPAPKDALNQ